MHDDKYADMQSANALATQIAISFGTIIELACCAGLEIDFRADKLRVVDGVSGQPYAEVSMTGLVTPYYDLPADTSNQ